MGPIPTIHPKSIPLSQVPVSCEPRKLPKFSSIYPDESNKNMISNL